MAIRGKTAWLSGGALLAALVTLGVLAHPGARLASGAGGHKRGGPAGSTAADRLTPAPAPSPSGSLKLAAKSSGQVQGAATSSGAGSVYQVNEQFTGSSLNSALWQAMTLPKGYRNNEEQDYSPAQVQVTGGQLLITATRDGAGAWHSGEVHSKWSYKYGDFEVRMAMSQVGPGVWPAAWLLGLTDPWPGSGEIDLLEAVNADPKVYGTIHGGGPAGHWQLGSVVSGVDVTQYHTYKLSKRPGRISWWVDGVKRAEWSEPQTPVGGVWPFETHRNFAILNLAMGGTWPGPTSEATPPEVTMSVDWFRVSNGS